VVEGRQSDVFSKIFPGEKGSVRRCIVMQQAVFLYLQILEPSLHSHFHAVAVKGHSGMRN
jgi:hypothetical protein